MGLLDGKVAVITGAGGGIGRCHALAFAKEGAKVVVNDLGSARDGLGQTSSMAEAVVDEIKKAGGQAVADFHSVSTWEGAKAIIQTAISTFGGIDILVNNAGILRDKTLWNMTEDMWDAVIGVHLKGTAACTHHAVVWMKENNRPGSVINTTSIAGLKGNFGQTNYAAAKAGIYGMTLTWAAELRKYNIRVNAVAPLAKTRLTEDIEQVGAEMKPEQVAPVALFFASDLAKDVTGRILGVHGQHLFEYRMENTTGFEKKNAEMWSAKEIAGKFEEITKFGAPAPAAGGGDDVTGALEGLPARFLKDKASGWTANIHFEVAGAGEWSMAIANQTCTVQKGKQGKATCTVKTDAATIVGIINGAVNAQKAFMGGKIKADNLQDMMKFGSTFDMSPKTAPAAAAGVTDVPTGKDAVVDRAFNALPGRYIKDKAADWSSILGFEVKDIGTYTLTVKPGEATLIPGRTPTVTTTVKVDKATIVDLLSGKLQPQKAFMMGKIKSDNMKDMMKFGSSFDLTKQEDFSKEPPPPETGLNKKCVGKVYEGKEAEVSAKGIEAYAKATNDENPRYLEAGKAVAPPLFLVTMLGELLLKAMEDKELRVDMLRLVHGEQEFEFLAPIQAGDKLKPKATITSIEDKSSGQLMQLAIEFLKGSTVVAKARTGIFIRGDKKGEKGAAAAPEAKPSPLYKSDMKVAADQAKRYAAASGDTNPIHLDPDIAQAAGLKACILHGLCTMAFATKAIVDQSLKGDSSGLKRISVRFSKPVYMGETVSTVVWEKANGGGKKTLGFETVNPEGVAVITNGEADISA
jgi:NAD(P)-dependent dehydrogenase (short-subunit alcohol dehydrogenase family)/acyl dehydratase/putative sterol carrier protein